MTQVAPPPVAPPAPSAGPPPLANPNEGTSSVLQSPEYNPSAITPSNLAVINSSANLMVGSAINAYGGLPDPRLSANAIATGAATDVTNAILDPSTAGLTAATPVGQVPNLSSLASGPVPQATGQPYVMSKSDWASYQSRVKAMSGTDAQWKSLGSIPTANLDWLKATEGSSASTVKKWQAYLNQTGFGQVVQGQSGKTTNLEVSGVWDANTTTAMTGFLTARFTPDALYSTNQATRNNTRAFMTSALGVDPNSLQSELGTDPAFKAQIVTNWLHSEGPDTDQRSGIAAFQDAYGQQNIPPEIADLAGGFWSNLGDSITHIPLLGFVPSLALGVAHGDFNPLDALAGKGPSAYGADISDNEMTAAEKAALAPALQAAQGASGFMGFLNSWDTVRTKALLATLYTVGDAFGGKGLDNPFDPGSAAGKGATENASNMAAGIFGQQFAQDYPLIATLFNQVVNIADDPLMYTGLLGLETRGAEAAGDGLKDAQEFFDTGGGTGVKLKLTGNSAARSTLLTPTTIRDVFRDPDRSTPGFLLDAVLKPRIAARQEMAKMIGNPALTPLDRLDLLNLTGDEATKMQDVVEQIGKEPNVHLRYALLEKNFKEYLHGTDHLYQMAQARKAISPKVFSRLGAGKQIRLLLGGHGSMTDRSRMLDLTDPIAVARTLRDTASAYDMTPAEINPILAKVMGKDIVARQYAITEFRKLEETAGQRLFGSQWDSIKEKIASRRKAVGNRVESDQVSPLHLPMRQDDGSIGEGSTRTTVKKFDTGDPAKDEMLQDTVDHLNQNIQNAQAELTRKLGLMVKDGDKATIMRSPQYQEHSAIADRQMQTFRDQIKALQDQNKTVGRDSTLPVPATSGGFQVWANTKYTPYEILSMHSPVLRKAERVQQAVHADAWTSTWKKLTLGKMSSSLRIVGGDESARPIIDITLNNPKAGAQAVHDLFTGVEDDWRLPEDVHDAWKDAGSDTAKAKVLTTWLQSGGIEAKQYLDKQGRLGAVLRQKRDLEKVVKKLNKKLTPDYEHIPSMPQDAYFNAHDALTGKHDDDFIPYAPGDVAYGDALRHFIEDLHGQTPEARVWTDAVKAGKTPERAQRNGIAALSGWLKTDDPAAKEWRRVTDGGLKSGADRQKFAAQLAFNLKTMTKYQPGTVGGDYLFNMLHAAAHGEAKAYKKTFDRFIKENAKNEDMLPIISGRRPYGQASSLIGQKTDQMSTWFQHKFTDAMVNNQREKTFIIKYKSYRRAIDAAYPDWTKEAVQSRAVMHAANWVKKNTYQGTRTLTATALRTAFPFWGATANFNRFVMRQWAAHPWTIRPTLELLGSATAAQTSGGQSLPIPFSGALMARFGMGNGDDATFEPGHAFFLTSEGYSGMVPGLGPALMLPLKEFLGNNQQVTDVLKNIPGFDYLADNTPMFPWAEEVASGIQMQMAPTNHPFLEGVPFIGRPTGYYEKAVNEKEKQQHAQFAEGDASQDTSATQAEQQVGWESFGQGVAAFVAPLQITPTDPKLDAINSASQAYDAATSEAQKQQVEKAFPDVAPLFKMWDPNTTQDQKDQIVAANPWVQSYDTGISTSTASGTTTSGSGSPSAYDEELQQGQIQYLTPDGYIDKLMKNDEFNRAWNQFNAVDNAYKDFLTANQLAPTSALAEQYKALNYTPAVQQIVNENPNWAAQFTETPSTSVSGLTTATAPIRSVAAWEVIPQNSALESQTTQSWRQALSYINNAQVALYDLNSSGGASTAEKEQVTQGLYTLLQQLGANDPTFAGQIGKFSYDKVSDLINLEVDNEVSAATYG